MITKPEVQTAPISARKKTDTESLLLAGESLDDAALRLTKELNAFDNQIDGLTKQRSATRLNLRHIEGKIVTRNLQKKSAS